MSDLKGDLRSHCLHCSAPLDPPARRRGQEKKFCSSVCRSHYHAALRARAWEAFGRGFVSVEVLNNERAISDMLREENAQLRARVKELMK